MEHFDYIGAYGDLCLMLRRYFAHSAADSLTQEQSDFFTELMSALRHFDLCADGMPGTW